MSDRNKVSNFTAQNVAIGQNASITPYTDIAPARDDALREVRYFISLIPEQAEPLPQHAHEIHRQAMELEAALSRKKLNRRRIESILNNLVIGDSSIVALANAADAVHTAVTRLFNWG